MAFRAWLAVVALCAAGAPAHAQSVEVEVPSLVLDLKAEADAAAEAAFDLDNVVQTAAKAVTTVQEAPAIVTVITERDIDAHNHRTLQDILDTVPGWMRNDTFNHQFPFLLTRGTVQAMLYMHDGTSLFDPIGNVPQVGRVMPPELIKRIEIITGPGGVLWGANSYLGIVNIVTKDAEDIDGVEASASAGSGDGDRAAVSGYLMVGEDGILDGALSLFAHLGFQSYVGERLEKPQLYVNSPTPAPNSAFGFGSLAVSDQARSMLTVFDGKLNYRELELAWFTPLKFERHQALGLSGVVVERDLPEDALAECSKVPFVVGDPNSPVFGQRNPEAFSLDDPCVDRARIGRNNQLDWFDRYLTARYDRQFAEGRGSHELRAYAVQFVRDFKQLLLMAPSNLLEGGLSIRLSLTSYRVGGAYDGSYEVGPRLRLLYGAEAFREWAPSDVTDSRQGEGKQGTIVGPYDLGRVGSLPCPIMPNPAQPGTAIRMPDCPLTAVFETDRAVLGAYLNPQFKLSRDVSFDAGVRVQAAPEALGKRGYDTELLGSTSLVYGFARGHHAKLNYAQGFRPPVFNNTDSNGASIQIEGDPNIKTERSEAYQVEVNGRVLKDTRRIAQLTWRADYSYTRLQNLIQFVGERYENAADRGIHSVELLGDLALTGGHRLELGYTWLRVSTADFGQLTALPEHWFTLGGVFAMIPDRLQTTTTLRVIGAMEDPNRLVEYRGLMAPTDVVFVQPHEVVFDRLPPAAEVQLGVACLDCLAWSGVDGVTVRADAYNALNTRHYNADPFQNYEARVEILPNPYADARFVVSATYAP
jgi:outer membrane receptor protein involved in Fe transport